MLIVKNYDTKKKSPKNVYLYLKIGKRSYRFTADSFRELKDWSALLRQAIDNGKRGKGNGRQWLHAVCKSSSACIPLS